MERESTAEHFGAVAESRRAGLVRLLGTSGIEPRHLAKAEAQAIAPVVGVPNRYGPGDDQPATEELLRLCGEQDVDFVPI
ncbi:aldo/keto reductase [Streptomyces phaeoluteigriseus]|uniref:aldo/keto reductase n=1 Tax=Streptomyces phaeoluteigriseus TaxID=114686 RepID=UPI00338D6DF2